MTTPITDPFQFDELLTPAQRALRDQVREYMERVVRPAINDYWERGEIALELALGLRDLPIVGGTQRGYGCAELDCLSDGLVKYEICRVDGSISTLFGVHSGVGDWLDRDAGFGGAEAALAAGDGAYGKAGRVRADGAGAGIGRGACADHGSPSRRALRA